MSRAREGGARRTLLTILGLAAFCLLALWLMLRYLEGYLERSAARSAQEPVQAPPPPAAGGGAVPDGPRGSVRFADGAPAAGARVAAVAADGTETALGTTGADGTFDRSGTAGGARLRAALGPAVADGAAEAPLTLPPTFALAGVVQHPDRSPVAGAQVRCAGVSATTAADGRFALADVPSAALREGELALVVEREGRPPSRQRLPLDRPAPWYRDLTLRVE